MRARSAAFVLLTAVVTACSGGSSSSTPAPTTSARTPTSTPTFTQLGTLAISQVFDVIPFVGEECPKTLPEVQLPPDRVVACDSQPRRTYVLGEPVVDEREIEATTVAQQDGASRWTVFIQLSTRGARALAAVPGKYAVVYNGVVLRTSAATTNGLVQIDGLSKVKAQRLARALNPS